MSENRIAIFREIVIVLVLSLVLVSSLSIKTVNAQAGQVALLPTDDTYVDSSNPNVNYGSLSSLQIENYHDFLQNYENITKTMWLRFDLSSIPDGAVDQATLHLFALGGQIYNVCVYSCSNSSWTESNLTYANMPSYNTTSMDYVYVVPDGQWYNWSVVDAVKDALNDSFKTVTIVLFDPSPHPAEGYVSFYSKESPVDNFGDYRPAMTVHWSSAVPEYPAFLVSAFFMIATLIAVAFYRKVSLSHTVKKAQSKGF
jgi:hypothetical protein